MSIRFSLTDDPARLVDLKKSWRTTLTAPQDGMWEALRELAKQWEITLGGKLIGYACVDADNQLLQFYLEGPWLKNGVPYLQQFIKQERIGVALVGTHNPQFLSLVMHLQKRVKVHTYLFHDFEAVPLPPRSGAFKAVKREELASLVDFYHYSIKAPKAWLTDYLGKHVREGEVFTLHQAGKIVGACEVRRSPTYAHIADLGMVVSPDFRQQGYGTFLLGKAKEIALQWNREPICSCEKENIGSLKSIQHNGFRSVFQLLGVGL